MSRIAVRSMMLCVGTAAASLTISTLFAFGTSTPPASLTTLDTAYTQNFDTLATVGASNVLPAGWSLEESGTSTRNDGNYTAGTGSDNAGDVYAFGPAGSTDRAFGTLLSGTLTPIIGASFTNNTGATITSLDISYTAEQWRCGATGRADELDFQYSTTATGLNVGAFTGVSALNFVAPVQAAVGARDGNAVGNRAAVSGTISGLSIAPGATFWIRWTDFNAAGADDGLAIDDFTLTPHGTVATQPSLSINDVMQAEGQSGTTNFTFTVSLDSPAGEGGVTFDIATADDSATTTSDYVAQSLTAQVIPQGTSTYPFTVQVNGDLSPEPNDTFFVTVTNIVGATPGDVQGLGTIQNDDCSLTHIHDIQGSGDTSPFAGQSVTTAGIVTGVKSNGFFIQEAEADYDADPNTSEGIFVFTSSAPPPAAAVGNLVTVSATISEFIPTPIPSAHRRPN